MVYNYNFDIFKTIDDVANLDLKVFNMKDGDEDFLLSFKTIQNYSYKRYKYHESIFYYKIVCAYTYLPIN